MKNSLPHSKFAPALSRAGAKHRCLAAWRGLIALAAGLAVQPITGPIQAIAVEDGTVAEKSAAPVSEDQARALLATVLQCKTLATLKESVAGASGVVNNPNAAAAIRTLIEKDQRAPAETKRMLSLIFSQFFKDYHEAGADPAVLRLAIRCGAFGVVTAPDTRQLRQRLESASPDFVQALNEEEVTIAVTNPDGLFPARLVPALKQLFRDLNAQGSEAAANRFSVTAGLAGAGGGPNSKGPQGTPVAASAMVGAWSAAVVGQASGMSVQSRYVFETNGTFTTSAASAFDFGAAGTAIGSRGPAGGTWTVSGRTLTLTPNGGQPRVLEITDFGESGMITRSPNGDRRLWEKSR